MGSLPTEYEELYDIARDYCRHSPMGSLPTEGPHPPPAGARACRHSPMGSSPTMEELAHSSKKDVSPFPYG